MPQFKNPQGNSPIPGWQKMPYAVPGAVAQTTPMFGKPQPPTPNPNTVMTGEGGNEIGGQMTSPNTPVSSDHGKSAADVMRSGSSTMATAGVSPQINSTATDMLKQGTQSFSGGIGADPQVAKKAAQAPIGSNVASGGLPPAYTANVISVDGGRPGRQEPAKGKVSGTHPTGNIRRTGRR